MPPVRTSQKWGLAAVAVGFVGLAVFSYFAVALNSKQAAPINAAVGVIVAGATVLATWLARSSAKESARAAELSQQAAREARLALMMHRQPLPLQVITVKRSPYTVRPAADGGPFARAVIRWRPPRGPVREAPLATLNGTVEVVLDGVTAEDNPTDASRSSWLLNSSLLEVLATDPQGDRWRWSVAPRPDGTVTVGVEHFDMMADPAPE